VTRRGRAGLSYPLESEVRFRNPVFLPSKAAYKVYKVQHPAEGVKFLYVVENPGEKDPKKKLCLEGYIRNMKP
jgi:hypothetical protein